MWPADKKKKVNEQKLLTLTSTICGLSYFDWGFLIEAPEVFLFCLLNKK